MFYVVISEKGGSQKRLEFDKKEITVGRVQGNDIILPKGNVSKRHSRVVYKDGKFIIVDLNSTNGTFVNGRKISSPQVVKSADRIYIGDFTLSVETPEEAGARALPIGPASIDQALMPGPDFDDSSPSEPGGVYEEPAEPQKVTTGMSPVVSAPNGAARNGAPAPEPLPEARAQRAAGPAAQMVTPIAQPATPPRNQIQRAEPVLPVPSPTPSFMARPVPVVPVAPQEAPLGRKQCAEPPIRPSLPHSVTLENQAALLGLLREDFDTAKLWRRGIAPENERAHVEQSLQGALQRYSQERRIPVGINQQTLLQDALEEAVHLGPLAKLLADENVAEILVNGPHQIISSLASGEERVEPFGFATERGLISAIERLLRASGRDLPADADTLDARLHDGTRLLAIFPPSAAQGTVLRIQRPIPAPFTLQELVEREVLSPQAAEFLDVSVRAGRSVVVVGGASSGRGILLGALSTSIPDTEPLALLTPGAGLSLPERRVMYFDPSAEPHAALVPSACRMGASRFLARDLPLVALGELLQDSAARPVSVLASLCAHGTQDALGRLSAALRCASPEGDEESLQVLLGRAVSLIVYIDRGPRVVQVSEVLPLQDGEAEIACLDIFLASGEQLLPTREQPSFWADLVMRGEADGTSLFE